MPPHRVLLTGASGYLGGSLLTQLSTAKLPSYEKLYALVRKDEHKAAVKAYGALPLNFNVSDRHEVESAVVDNRITIVLFLIDAVNSMAQTNFIEALAKVKNLQGGDVHFVHVSSTTFALT